MPILTLTDIIQTAGGMATLCCLLVAMIGSSHPVIHHSLLIIRVSEFVIQWALGIWSLVIQFSTLIVAGHCYVRGGWLF
jgi:hypothetical protein